MSVSRTHGHRNSSQQRFHPYQVSERPALHNSTPQPFADTIQSQFVLPLPTARASSTEGALFGLAANLRRSSSQQLLAASGELVKSVARPVIRKVTNAVGGATDAVSWATSGFTSKLAARSFTVISSPQPKAVTLRTPVSAEVKLLTGADQRIEVDSQMTVAQFKKHVQEATGLSPQQQVIVIAEDRARLHGISNLAKRVQTSIKTTRHDVRSAVISWVNFIFLPEVFNRELYGRGVISWAKGTNWYQSLQEAQNRCAVAAAATQDPTSTSAKIQIEQLSGQVLLMEVEQDAGLGELKLAIQHRLGILIEQQRIIVLEKRGPGRLTTFTNMMLLHTFAGMKAALGVAAWAGSTLLTKQTASFPVEVRTTTGRPMSLTITGETTVNEIRCMLENSMDSLSQSEEDIQAISFPPRLPRMREELPQSHIIRAVGV